MVHQSFTREPCCLSVTAPVGAAVHCDCMEPDPVPLLVTHATQQRQTLVKGSANGILASSLCRADSQEASTSQPGDSRQPQAGEGKEAAKKSQTRRPGLSFKPELSAPNQA